MTTKPDTSPENLARERTVIRLRDGVVEREKRWQGDTHDDLGGCVDYDATDTLMNEAADLLEALAARVAELEAGLKVTNACNNGLGRLNDVVRVRAEVAEAKLAASEARVERLAAKLALVQRALEKTDQGLEYMGLYAIQEAPHDPAHIAIEERGE